MLLNKACIESYLQPGPNPCVCVAGIAAIAKYESLRRPIDHSRTAIEPTSALYSKDNIPEANNIPAYAAGLDRSDKRCGD